MSIAEELVVDETAKGKTAVVYRMVTDEHVCPFGIKTVDLLKRKGFEVEDNWLTNRADTDALTICDSILAMSLKIRIRKPTRLSS